MHNSDSIESNFVQKTDSIKEKSVKAFFVRIPYNVIKKINFVEFTYNENGFQKKIYTPIGVISFNYRLLCTNFWNEQE